MFRIPLSSALSSIRNLSSSLNHELIGNKYSIITQIAKGGFGVVYLGKDIENGQDVIIKKEIKRNEGSLRTESEVYTLLNRIHSPKFPKMYYHGYDRRGRSVIVVEKLGSSLEDILEKRKHISRATIAKIGIQILRQLESFHNLGFVHCDIHIGNIMTARHNKNEVHIIDFGSSVPYRDRSGRHISIRNSMPVRLNINFASLRYHENEAPSRMWDIESLAFVFKVLFDGKLPWEIATTRGMTRLKSEHTPKKLFANMGSDFEKFLDYCRKSSYGHRPNYSYLKSLLRNVLHERGDRHEERLKW